MRWRRLCRGRQKHGRWWSVVARREREGEGEGEVEGREGGRAGEQERDASERVLCGVAGQRRWCCCWSPCCWLVLLLLQGCAPKRRCAGCGPREPLLHPEDCPSLACNVCKLHVYITLTLTLIVFIHAIPPIMVVIYIYCQSGNRVVSYILSGDLSPHCHQDPAASPNQNHALGQT